MPRLIDYKCYKCGNLFDVLWRDSEGRPESAICTCGNKAKRLFNAKIIIDTWSPMGGYDNDAQRDIDHFEKMKRQGKVDSCRSDGIREEAYRHGEAQRLADEYKQETEHKTFKKVFGSDGADSVKPEEIQ